MSAFVAKDDDGVDTRERREDGGTLAFRNEWPVSAFELPAGRIGVEADDKDVAELPGALKVTDVTEV